MTAREATPLIDPVQGPAPAAPAPAAPPANPAVAAVAAAVRGNRARKRALLGVGSLVVVAGIAYGTYYALVRKDRSGLATPIPKSP